MSPSLREATTRVDVAVSVSSTSKGDVAVLDVRNIDTGSIRENFGCEVGLRAESTALSGACASPRKTTACTLVGNETVFRVVPCSHFLFAPTSQGT